MTTQSRISEIPLSGDAPARDNSSSPAPGGAGPLVITGQGDFTQSYTPAISRRLKTAISAPWLTVEPFDVYHAKAKNNLSSHALADFRHCPKSYRDAQLGLTKRKDTPAFRFGRAAHTLILEGRERYEAQYAVRNSGAPTTGKEVLSCVNEATIEQMDWSVHRHIYARELLSDGIAESVIRCKYQGLACQARLDWLNPSPDRGIVDLKTCRNLDEFEDDCSRWGYVHQLAFYRSMVAMAGKYVPAVHVIAVEKQKPYRCGVWAIHHNALTHAVVENITAMAELELCRETGVWPTRFESMRLIDRL